MQIEDALFLAIRLGLRTQQPSDSALRQIAALDGPAWRQLRDMANKQGMSAIALDGIHALCARYGQDQVAPLGQLAKWRKFVRKWSQTFTDMEMMNSQQAKVTLDLASIWSDAGCRVMVMKGQANGVFYPHPNHRSPGDIDCYLFENYTRGNEIARNAGADVDENWYKHSSIQFKGETFENHQFFVHTRDGRRSKAMEKELEKELCVEEWRTMHNTPILLPPPQWNAMFLTYHALAHFLSEGLHLKQLADWAMFLHAEQERVDWPRFYEFCNRYHLRRFADATTDIAIRYFGVKIRVNGITSDSIYTNHILHNTLYEDDYVFSTGKSGWHNRWHLVINLFKYRWKYRDICEMNPIRQLWYYASGYIFKTEDEPKLFRA